MTKIETNILRLTRSALSTHIFPLLLLIGIIMPVETAAQEVSGLRFRRLDTRDGMSNSSVNCILEDSRGFVWIGTKYGLNRYDGFRFRTFNSDANDSTALRYDFVDALYETADGKLLLQQGAYYCTFDRRREVFDYNTVGWLQSIGLKGNIEKLFVDANKNYWIKMFSDDIYCYNPHTGKLTKMRFGDGRYGFPPQAKVSTFASHGRQTLMVTNTGDIMCMDGEKGEVEWVNSHIRKNGGSIKFDYTIHTSPDGNIWVLEVGHQWIYSQSTRQWYTTLKQYLTALGIGAAIPETVYVWDVQFDKLGRAWIATDHLGLLIADFRAKTLTRYTNDKTDETSLSDETLAKIFFAADGNVWIGTYKNGINQCVVNRANIRNLPMGNVNTIAEDKNGNYWFGTNDKGVVMYNPATQERVEYDKSNSGLRADVMVCSLADADGSVWFGTYGGGLSHFVDGKVVTLTQDGTSRGIANNNVWAIAQDGDQNIWIGTLGSGVQKIDRRSGAITTYDSHTSKISSDYVSSLQMADNGWIVVGTSDHYSLIDPKEGTVVNMDVSQDQSRTTKVSSGSTHVIIDSRGLMWYASPAGVNIFDNNTGKVTLLDKDAGLPGSNACSVIEDSRHAIWVVTEYGISQIRPRQDNGEWTLDIRNYSTRDGLLPGPYNQRSSCLTHDGLVLVGGVNGVDIINTLYANDNRRSATPLFSGLKIFDHEIEAGKEYDGRIVIDEAIDECRKVTLSHADDQFTVQLASDQVIADNNAQFIYSLDGFSDKWITTDAQNPNITFTGLPSGSYTLRVRQIEDNNDAGGNESRLDIEIEPPFYLSWWAFVIYALIVIAILYYWYGRMQKRLQLERLKMEHDTEEQRHEIKDKLYASMGEELREPFERAFLSLDVMMADEVDEQRYERQQDVRDSLESLLSRINAQLEKSGKSQLISPKIKDVEITSVDEKLVLDATKYVEDNLGNSDISVVTMSEALNMSRVNLYKRLISVTGIPPSEFIRNIRLQHAERLLVKSQLTVSEVCYKVGFTNPRYFSKYFKEKYGMIPSQYKAQNGEAPDIPKA